MKYYKVVEECWGSEGKYPVSWNKLEEDFFDKIPKRFLAKTKGASSGEIQERTVLYFRETSKKEYMNSDVLAQMVGPKYTLYYKEEDDI